jgi:alanine-glyoxylate transaminase/serine-glyoxylate transaminase/serine-pyruvate transaminase
MPAPSTPPATPLPAPLDPPRRILLGPGPSEPAPSVLAALARPTLGHLDPLFLAVMDEVRPMLRAVFGTQNELTFPVSGTGTAGMETVLVNLVEPGDRVVVGANGYFGERLVEIARRVGADVVRVEREWGRAVDPDSLREAAAGKRTRAIVVVHAETSTGAWTDLAPLRAIADECGAFLIADCVTSLGGMPVELDRHGVDAAYSGTQKCLSCPPGLSPVSLSPRALAHLRARKHPVQSWYLDLSLVASYWGSDRVYHHTAPINMVYGLHEALRLVLVEGLEARFARHARNARALCAGLEALGLELLVPAAERLAQLTSVRVPAGVDEAAVRRFLLEHYGIEIGGGLGPVKGKIWRIGLMGAGSSRRNVELCLAALSSALAAQGYRAKGDPLAAAAVA